MGWESLSDKIAPVGVVKYREEYRKHRGALEKHAKEMTAESKEPQLMFWNMHVSAQRKRALGGSARMMRNWCGTTPQLRLDLHIAMRNACSLLL